MDLRLAIPREDMARMLADRFRSTPEQLYNRIMSVLMAEGNPAGEETQKAKP